MSLTEVLSRLNRSEEWWNQIQAVLTLPTFLQIPSSLEQAKLVQDSLGVLLKGNYATHGASFSKLLEDLRQLIELALKDGVDDVNWLKCLERTLPEKTSSILFSSQPNWNNFLEDMKNALKLLHQRRSRQVTNVAVGSLPSTSKNQTESTNHTFTMCTPVKRSHQATENADAPLDEWSNFLTSYESVPRSEMYRRDMLNSLCYTYRKTPNGMSMKRHLEVEPATDQIIMKVTLYSWDAQAVKKQVMLDYSMPVNKTGPEAQYATTLASTLDKWLLTNNAKVINEEPPQRSTTWRPARKYPRRY